MHQPLLRLPPNRVRRNYRGGALLEKLCNRPGVDGNKPEDWIASTVVASNPGLEEIEGEGLAKVVDASGKERNLADLFADAPQYYLGSNPLQCAGAQLGFLVKLLDSAIRLPLQAHPTSTFARKHLGSNWGKLEAYVILATRPGIEAYIRLGFQRAPSPEEWFRIVTEQDIPAMDSCFDRVPVREGEVWLVPGGMPHAIGEGILLLEIMEPSDLVVRCEFEREGIVVPPAARFMQRDPAFALQIFDYEELSVSQVTQRFRITPQRISENEEQLIGHDQSSTFSVRRIITQKPMSLLFVAHVRIGVVTRGLGTLVVAGQKMELFPGAKFLISAQAPEGVLRPKRGTEIEILICSP